MRSPVLLLAAGQDNTPVAEVEAFAADVRAAGTEADLFVYRDAPHSFFDRRFDDYKGECADAWRRILEFIEARRAERSAASAAKRPSSPRPA